MGQVGDALGGAGGAAGKEHIRNVVAMARAHRDSGCARVTDCHEMQRLPARECCEGDGGRLATDDDGLERCRQFVGNLRKLTQLLGVDETESRRGIAKEIEEFMRLVEVRY